MLSKMQLINGILFSGVMGLLCANLARKKGKRPLVWLLLGFLFGIFGLILLYIVPSFTKEERRPAPPKPVERSDAWMRLWYYLDSQHKQRGPYEFPDFIKQVHEAKIRDETLVWGEGMQEWKRLSELPEEVSKEFFQTTYTVCRK